MNRTIALLAVSLSLVPAAALAASPAVQLAQAAPAPTGSNDGPIPTIPKTQIEPAPLSSPYEFISVATSADDFVLRAAKLAETRAQDPAVKTMAAKLAAEHAKMIEAAQAAGMADKVDIAKPGVDGEQLGLLGKLEAQEPAEFDARWIEAMIFVHQRSIAYYRGYQDKEGNLGAYAKQTLPTLVAHYIELTAAAPASGAGGEAPQQRAKAN